MHDPDSYDVYSEIQRRDARELIPYLVSKMSWHESEENNNYKRIEDVQISNSEKIAIEKDENIKILDFASGSGFNTQKVLLPLLHQNLSSNEKEKFRVYGIDLSQKMVDFANENYSGSNLSYFVSDILNEENKLPWKFDKIFSFFALHWIKDQKLALKRLFDLLKLSGELGIYFVSSTTVFNVYDAMSKIDAWKEYLLDVKNFIPNSFYSTDPGGDMREILVQIGYIVQESSVNKRKFTYDSLDIFITSMMAANPFIHRIPSDLQGDYKNDFKKCFEPYVKNVPSSERPFGIEVDYELIIIRASKPQF